MGSSSLGFLLWRELLWEHTQSAGALTNTPVTQRNSRYLHTEIEVYFHYNVPINIGLMISLILLLEGVEIILTDIQKHDCRSAVDMAIQMMITSARCVVIRLCQFSFLSHVNL